MVVRGCEKPLVPLHQFIDILKPYLVSREQYAADCSNSPATSELLKKLSTSYNLYLLFMAALWNRAGHYIFILSFVMAALLSRCEHYIFSQWFLSSIFFLFLT